MNGCYSFINMRNDSAKNEENEITHAHYVKIKTVQKNINRWPNQIHSIHVLGDISKVIVHLKVRFVISLENQDT